MGKVGKSRPGSNFLADASRSCLITQELTQAVQQLRCNAPCTLITTGKFWPALLCCRVVGYLSLYSQVERAEPCLSIARNCPRFHRGPHWLGHYRHSSSRVS